MLFDILDTITIGVLFIASVYLAYALVKTRHQAMLTARSLIQSELDLQAIRSRITEMESTAHNVSDRDFIKFLSDSREDAFTYIETVQTVLPVIASDVLEIEKAFNGNVPPSAQENIVSIAKNIKALLPD